MTTPTPLSIDQINAFSKVLDVQVRNNRVAWLVRDNNATSLIVKSCSPDDTSYREIRMEEDPIAGGILYGGGEFCLADEFVVVVTRGGSLIRIDFSDYEPRTVAEFSLALSSPVVSPDQRRLLLITSDGKVDSLLMVDLEGVNPPVVISDSYDFYMQPAWHPNGEVVVWVSWNNPSMPWNRSFLAACELSPKGKPSVERIIYSPRDVSLQQPLFSPDGTRLTFISDETGFLAIHSLPFSGVTATHDASICLTYSSLGRFPSPDDTARGEYSIPAWVEGLRHYAWFPDGTRLLAIRYFCGESRLAVISADPQHRWVTLLEEGALVVEGRNLCELLQLSLDPKPTPSGGVMVSFIGQGPEMPPYGYSMEIAVSPQLGELRFAQLTRLATPDDPVSLPNLDDITLSNSRHVSWTTPTGIRLNGILYPSVGDVGEKKSAIIQIHGGPTSQSRLGWAPRAQYFAGRGYTVLELNYRGSTGYGRDYMTAMDHEWCVTDIEDLVEARRYLVDECGIDPESIFIMGGSSGGCTVLTALADYPGLFAGGVSLYPVCDHAALDETTHKFERYYNEQLLRRGSYDERSPITKAHKIVDPVVIYHGAKDNIVLIDQSREVVEKIKGEATLHEYPEEGHGFRLDETVRDFYSGVESFIEKHRGR